MTDMRSRSWVAIALSGALSADVKGPVRVLRLEIATPFEGSGFIAAATAALAEEKVNVLVFSTFSFDYVLVQAELLDRAIAILEARGSPEVAESSRGGPGLP